MSQTQTTVSATATATTNPSHSVWTELLSKSTRRSMDANSTTILLGDHRGGLSSLLNKLADRAAIDATNHTQTLTGATGEYAVDYAYASVRNVNGPPASKDDVLARMHLWSLDDPHHASLIQSIILTNQPPTPAALAAPSAPQTPPTVHAATLESTCIVITFDLSEPWKAIESVTGWLTAIQKVMQPILSALPPTEAQALRTKISTHVQTYHTAAQADPSASPDVQQDGSTDTTDSNAAAATAGPPIDPAIPAQNLGIPIILAGLRGDLFSRHLSSHAGADEQFEFLTRQLRKIALEWGATLIYTSVSGGVNARSTKGGDRSVNIDVLQAYIYHRLYKFSLTPHASDDTANGTATSPSNSSSPSSSSPLFQPKVVGGTDDYGIYLPAGYDSVDLLETTAKTAVSAAFSDETPIEEVFKGAAGLNSTRNKASKGQQQFATVVADDNTAFFKNLKHALETGSGAPLITPSVAPQPARSKPAPSPTNIAGTNVNSPTAAGGSATSDKSGASQSAAPAASGSTPAAAGATPVKGQIAVKQFFRSLLTNTTKPEGNTKAAAAQKAVRANAEKELQRMTDGQNQS